MTRTIHSGCVEAAVHINADFIFFPEKRWFITARKQYGVGIFLKMLIYI